MKRVLWIAGSLALLVLLGCAPKKDEPATPETPAPKEAAAPETPAPEGVLPMNYMDAATALAADDFDQAKASLTALAKETTGELHDKAQAAADTGQLASMREKFKELSALAARMQLPPEYAVAYCPMYKNGSKWVQKKDKLANPYFGKGMQTCGSFIN
jgi:hypothetical protein